MLKLYYDANMPPIKIGAITQGSLNRLLSENKLTRPGNEKIAGATFNLSGGGDGFEEFWNYCVAAEYPIYLTQDCTEDKKTKFAIKVANKKYKKFAITIPDLKVGNIDIVLCAGSADYNSNFNAGTLSLMSYYSSPDNLSSNDAEWNFFLRKMLETEKQILNGQFTRNIDNLSHLYLTSPFLLCEDGLTSFNYSTSCNGYGVNASPFISFATMYFLVKGYRPIKSAKVKMHTDSDEMYLPAVSYNPANLNSSTFLYNYEDRQTFVVSSKSKSLDVSVVIGNYTVTKYQTIVQPFLQIPEKFVINRDYFIKDNDYNVTSLFTSSAKTRDDPNKFNSIYHDNLTTGIGYFQQTSDFLNLSDASKNEYADSTYLSNTTSDTNYHVPALVYSEPISKDSVGRSIYNSPYSTAGYGYVSKDGIVLSDYGVMTGSEISQMFYDGVVQDIEPDAPQYTIPEDDGNGGISSSKSDGGNGTWSDEQDDFSTQDDAPMPSSIALDGNYKLVKMSRTELLALAQQSWEDDGWLSHLKNLQGTSEIGQGITDVKCCFLNIPELQADTLTEIAGYALSSPISCKAISQFNEIDLGTLQIPRYFDCYLDYAPYTEFVVELPFAQPVKLSPELLVGDSVQVILRYDCLTSAAMYLIKNSTKLIAQVPCQIFYTVPFSSSEYTLSRNEVIANALVSLGQDVGGNLGSEAIGAMARKEAGSALGLAGAGMAVVGTGANLAKTAVEQEANRKITQISKGGSPGAVGAMGIKKAILKISRPYVQIPEGYFDVVGAPSGYIVKLSSCKGYVQVAQLIGSIGCNTDEYNAIVSALGSGVYM